MPKKFLALMRMGWSLTLEYRAQILIWMMSSFLVVVMLMVWLSISSKGPVGGFSSADFVSYYIVSLFVRQMTAVWSSWELDRMIRDGSLSPLLVRPVHPIVNEIAGNWAEKLMRIIMLMPIIVAMLLLIPHTPLALTPLNIAAFLFSLLCAWLISFLSDYLIGTLAFFTSQATAFVQMFFVVRMALSGVLAPLALFPDALQGALRWLPFRYMLSFSTEILIGRVSAQEMLFGFSVQLAWVAVFALGVRLLWQRAMRSYGAVGA